MKAITAARRLGILVLALAMMMSLAIPCFAAEENVISQARNGVVRILAYNEATDMYSTGSAFGIGAAGEETEYFVTNWHVVTDDDASTDYLDYPVGTLDVYILLTNDAITEDINSFNFDFSKTIPCQVIYAADKYPDVAILKAERKVPGRVALPLRSSREVEASDMVYSLGYPGSADKASVSDENQTAYFYADVESVYLNAGYVSRLADFEAFGGTYCLEHGAHINHGNSGGPLVDEQGYVVGINTYGITEQGSQFYYSVYTDYVMDYLNQLGIDYDYLGQEEPAPVLPIAAGVAAVLVIALAAFLLMRKKPSGRSASDTGLRVQYSQSAMMSGRRYVVSGTLRFGRAPDCNIRYENNAPGISGHHCEITVEKGRVYIRDLNSSHGTFVNGSRIAANQRVPLTVGTEVYLGGVKESFQIVKSTTK